MKSKGLSSVVGAVLLIMISVGAAASAWTFIDTITSTTQDNVEDRIDQRNEEVKAEINANFAYNSSDGFIMVTIQNSGSDALMIRDDGSNRLNLFVRGRPVDGGTEIYEEWDDPADVPEEISLGTEETVTLNTTSEFPPQGEDYTVEIFGPSDTSTTYICYNSGSASC